jgi:hypothetical protein
LPSLPGENIIIRRGPERNTGGVDTTIGNSVTCLTAWLVAIITFVSTVSIEGNLQCNCPAMFAMPYDERPIRVMTDSFRRLGLDLKLRLNYMCYNAFLPNITDPPVASARLPTFLKGTWYPIAGSSRSRMWGPLPSRLLKIGKSLRDPRELTGLPDMEASLRLFAAAITFSVKNYTWPPAIKTWLDSFHPSEDDKLAVVALSEKIRDEMKSDFYSLADTPSTQFGEIDFVVDERLSNRELANYYGVEPDLLVDFFVHLQSIRPLTHSEHPMWAFLAADYA